MDSSEQEDRVNEPDYPSLQRNHALARNGTIGENWSLASNCEDW